MLPFGIDVGYRPVSVSKINQLSPVKIINIGRLVWQKGQLLLIDAIFNLRKSGYDFTLDIIGEGELRPAIEERITACNLGGVVTLLGALPREQTLQHLAQADIFVFSSVSEGFGIVLLEAMLCQVAIVAPRLNGIPEIIQNDETGLLFEVGSVSDLSDKIEALITDAPKRHLLVETAYKVVRETYDQKHLMTKLLEKHQSCN